jgi:Ca2+ transporting ATPase
MNDAFSRSPEVILDHFKVDPDKGLTSSQAAAALEKYGKNGTDLHPPHFNARSPPIKGGQHRNELD